MSHDITQPQIKEIAANQKALDALPLNSGTWSIETVAGMYVRCRRQSKSFFLQRRVKGQLVRVVLGATLRARSRSALTPCAFCPEILRSARRKALKMASVTATLYRKAVLIEG